MRKSLSPSTNASLIEADHAEDDGADRDHERGVDHAGAVVPVQRCAGAARSRGIDQAKCTPEEPGHAAVR